MRLIKYTLTIVTLMLFISSGQAQKGIISTYNAEAIYLSFTNFETKETFREPFIMGEDVVIKYNASFESFSISYKDVKDRERKTINLSFVRYDNQQKGTMIMKDSHGNPFSVYNQLNTENSLSIVSHKLIEDTYLSIQSIFEASLVN